MQRHPRNKLTNKKKTTITDDEIIASIKMEASSFVPNDLSAIEKATGTFNPFKEREDLALTEKVKNEGASIVPNLEKKIYAETGAKKKFSLRDYCRRHSTALALISLALVGGVTTTVILSSTAPTDSNTITLVTLTIESASDVNGDNAVSYSPSFTFLVNENNIAQKKTLTYSNYSASLIGQEESATFAQMEDCAAPTFTSSLLKPAYQTGYLQTIDQKSSNHINISILSADSDYAETYKDSYTAAINDALTSSAYDIHAYATISFNNLCSEHVLATLKTLSASKAKKVGYLYLNFNLDGTPLLDIDTVANADDEVLDAMFDTYISLRKTSLSPLALKACLTASAKAYSAYSNHTTNSEEDIASLKQTLSSKPGALPWSTKENLQSVATDLLDDSYYLVEDPFLERGAGEYKEGLTIGDEKSALAYFFHIQNEMMKNLDKTAYLSLLASQKTRAETSSSPFPDGFNGSAMVDHGDHGGPGGNEGHAGPGWGNGGVR